MSYEVRGGDVSAVPAACTVAAPGGRVFGSTARVCLAGPVLGVSRRPSARLLSGRAGAARSPETVFVLGPDASSCGTSFVAVPEGRPVTLRHATPARRVDDGGSPTRLSGPPRRPLTRGRIPPQR